MKIWQHFYGNCMMYRQDARKDVAKMDPQFRTPFWKHSFSLKMPEWVIANEVKQSPGYHREIATPFGLAMTLKEFEVRNLGGSTEYI